MRPNHRLLLVCLLSLGLADACGKDQGLGPTPVPVATGSWEGNFSTDFGAARMLTLSLQEDGGHVTGAWEITGGGGNSTGSVDGSHANADLTLSLSAPGDQPMQLSGKFMGSDRVDGTLGGIAGLTDAPITLTRQ
jgi:hypothetical protein